MANSKRTQTAIRRDCTYYYGMSPEAVRPLLDAEIAERKADARERARERATIVAMRDGYRSGTNSGHVGELEIEERSSWAALDTDLENVGRSHDTMGFAYRECTIGESSVVVTCEVHGAPDRDGDMIAKAVLFRIAHAEGTTPGYGLRYRVAHELISEGIISRNVALAMVGEASAVGGFEPVALATWLRTSEVANQERHAQKTPTTSWASVKVER